MAVRTTFVDKWNYTNRKRIKQKPELFFVEQISRTSDTVTLKVQWDEAGILKETRVDPAAKRVLVLDVLFLGNTQRLELPSGGAAQEFVLEECPDNVVLEFRLKLVSKEEETQGVLLAATSPFNLKTGSGPNEGSLVTSGFLDLNKSDSLGSRIWAVTWPSEGPMIFINRSYFEKSKERPYFAAHVFPEILRAVMTGILLRNDDLDLIEDQPRADEWLTFVEQVLEFPLRGDDAELEDGIEERLELVEKIVTAFADRKWRNGKTLLEELI
ncbi:hypothetical protein [Erythrobacter sanguineus]|uniref:Uncharacterized protein n=1 Tax=Erythrobacter sanguineus TaxID=198312 RepID=A0A1M7RYC1_9SPHN|nr:hypothetical protein [Erythrobacter sanguineus]SHN51062.1 hypothetical protein SAMN02745193_00593 [Erythrobacter sanguineus]